MRCSALRSLNQKDRQPITAFHVVPSAMGQFAQDGAHMVRAVHNGETPHARSRIIKLFAEPPNKTNVASV